MLPRIVLGCVGTLWGCVGVLCVTLGCFGLLWDALGSVGLPWVALGCCGLRCVVMGFVGLRWLPLGLTVCMSARLPEASCFPHKAHSNFSGKNAAANQGQKTAEMLNMASVTNSWNQIRKNMRRCALTPMKETCSPHRAHFDCGGANAAANQGRTAADNLTMAAVTNSWTQIRVNMQLHALKFCYGKPWP